MKTNIDARFCMEQGKYFLGKKDYQKALQLFNAINSGNNSALEFIVDCYSGLDNSDAGVGLLINAIKKQPQNTSFWNKLADIYFLREEYEFSVAALDQCFKRETTKELIEKKLNCLSNLNSFDEIVNFYNEISDKINENSLSFSSVYLAGLFSTMERKAMKLLMKEIQLKILTRQNISLKSLVQIIIMTKTFLLIISNF
jgi:tetratricopeptide (TPR) repeat protein